MAESMESSLLTQIVQELKQIRVDFNSEQQETRKLIEEKFNNDQEEKAEINRKLEKQEGRIKYIEQGARRRNLIVYGIGESENENFNELKGKVDHLLNTTMGLDVKREEIDEFFRLGKKTEGRRDRPIIVKMISNWRKIDIMKNRGKLKGTKIFIENDLNEEEKAEKKNLIAEMREMKSKGQAAYIRGKTLVIASSRSTNQEREEDAPLEMQNTGTPSEDKAGPSQMDTTIYQTPLNTPGKRYLSERSPENKKEEKQKTLPAESAMKKKKLQQAHRFRANSEGQITLDKMISRAAKNKQEVKNDESRNIGYVSVVHDPKEKREGKETTEKEPRGDDKEK